MPPLQKGALLRSLLNFFTNRKITANYYPETCWNDLNHPAVRLGQFLSAVLRHRAAEFGLDMSPMGYVDMLQIMRIPAFQARCKSSAQLHWVVHNNPKGRFEFMVESPYTGSLDETSDQVPFTISLRALQGHSHDVSRLLDANVAMTPVTPLSMPSYVAHGTRHHLINSILK